MVGCPGSSLRLDLKSLTGNILNLYQQLCYSWVFLAGERRHTLQNCFYTSKSKIASHQKCSPMLKKPSTFTEAYLKFEKTIACVLFVFKPPGEISSEMTYYKPLDLSKIAKQKLCCQNLKNRNYTFL